MKAVVYFGSLLVASLITSQQAVAGASELAQSGVDAASSTAAKTEGAVKRGLNAAADGVERGARAAGRAADRLANKLGLPAGQASSTNTARQAQQPPAPTP